MNRALFITLALAVLAAYAWAQPAVETLEAQQRIETRLFDSELQRYDRARLAEREAHQTLRTRSDGLDRALKRPRMTLEQLERLETAVTQARETAYAASRDLAALRHQLYRQMARLAEIQTELDRERGRQLIPPSQLDGFWEIEFEPTGEIGMLKLRVEGTLVTGTYRTTGPRSGSLRGTIADHKVDLERIDNANGFDSVLEGEFNPATRQIRGGWTAVDLSGGRLGGGTWKARKLSPAEEENLELDPDA